MLAKAERGEDGLIPRPQSGVSHWLGHSTFQKAGWSCTVTKEFSILKHSRRKL